MIDLTDQDLKAWVQQVLGNVEVSLEAPRDDSREATSGQEVSIYLLNLIHKPAASSGHTLPLEISLHYLITTWADAPETAHRLLGELVFAALETPKFEVQLEPVPNTVWTALNRMPRPNFVLSVPLKRDRPHRQVPLVQVAPVLQTAPLQAISGKVLGPGNIPITNAQVEIPGLRRVTDTDTQGRFTFATIPVHPPVRQLLVRAKGRQFSVVLEPPTPPEPSIPEPLLIYLQDLET
jgi:Pvc16 N-terminal domain